MATYDWLQPAHPRTRRSRSPALPLSRFSAPPLPLFHSPALPLPRSPALPHLPSTPLSSPTSPTPLSFLSLGGRNTRHAAVGRAGGAAHHGSLDIPCNPMLCLSLTHPMLRLPVRRIDDPLLWGGQRGLRIRDPKLCRWTLTASEICFTGLLDSYIFRIGKSIPVSRNQGVFQPGMDEALLRLQQGDWLNIFPEARIIQQHGPIPRLKWGLASLLDRLCPSLPPPILLCVGHSGLERVSGLLDRLCPSLPPPILLCVGHSGIDQALSVPHVTRQPAGPALCSSLPPPSLPLLPNNEHPLIPQRNQLIDFSFLPSALQIIPLLN
ncbi:unnamed protein product [Closterium sp. Naga37s-1]|nr:unnamed protein product [Closterium sp. Naga37s-1]